MLKIHVYVFPKIIPKYSWVFFCIEYNEYFAFFKGDPGVMGPFGMPGASIPGPPGPKVCVLGTIISFTWTFVGGGRRLNDTSELEI